MTEIRVPTLGESVTEATIGRWFKKAGDAVAVDEPLVELETDKVTIEVPAPSAGTLGEIVAKDGETVAVGALLGQINDGAASAKPAAAAAPAKAAAPAAPPPPAAALAPAPAAPKAPPADAPLAPSVRRLSAESGVDASTVPGSGKDGRVTKGDVLGAVASGARPAAPAPLAAPAPKAALPVVAAPAVSIGDRPEQRVPMSRLRARIAERLLQSQAQNAILTTFNEVDMAPVMALRKKYQEKFEKEHGVKLGFMSFFVKAAVAALKRYPVINASIDGNDIVYHGYFDIGIAVGSPRGLVVPILRNADQMTFAEIEKKIAEFGQKAKDGKLSLEEMTGGTFSISNGGTFGSMLSTPIINPPQSAILGMHKIEERPIAVKGQVVIRPMMYVAVSYDHRIIDGREAVLGLVAMKDALEDPSRLLFDI